MKFSYNSFNRPLDSPFNGHRVTSSGNVLESFVDDSLGQYYRSRSSITCRVVSLGRSFFDKLRAHVLKRIGQFYFFSYSDTITTDERRPKLFVQHYISTPGSKGNFNCICQCIDTNTKGLASFLRVGHFLCRHFIPPSNY